MSDGVPLALAGRKPPLTSFLCGSRDCAGSQGHYTKIRLHAEALSSGYIAAPRSRAGAGFNDTIVSR